MRSAFVIILSLLAVAFVCGCAEEEKAHVKTCADYAYELVPQNITLVRYYWSSKENDYFWALVGNDRSGLNPDYAVYWNDGTKIDIKTACFMHGTSTGEYVTHYYLSSCGSGKNELSYSKMVTTSTGKIVGTRRFSINPELMQVNGTESSIKLFRNDDEETPMMQFIFVKKSLTSCYWIFENGSTVNMNGTIRDASGAIVYEPGK